MRNYLKLGFCGFALLMLVSPGIRADERTENLVLYSEDFEKHSVGSVPDNILVVDGGFTVKEGEKGKYFELPGAPLETYSALFGDNKRDGIEVKADILGTGKGRRFPVIGVGLGGVGGYRLQSVPGKKVLEIRKGDQVLTNAPANWVSGVWTEFKLSIVPAKLEGKWLVSGSVKVTGSEAKAVGELSIEISEPPASGKASIWGVPYSETAIWYDNLVVKEVKRAK